MGKAAPNTGKSKSGTRAGNAHSKAAVICEDETWQKLEDLINIGKNEKVSLLSKNASSVLKSIGTKGGGGGGDQSTAYQTIQN